MNVLETTVTGYAAALAAIKHDANVVQRVVEGSNSISEDVVTRLENRISDLETKASAVLDKSPEGLDYSYGDRISSAFPVDYPYELEVYSKAMHYTDKHWHKATFTEHARYTGDRIAHINGLTLVATKAKRDAQYPNSSVRPGDEPNVIGSLFATSRSSDVVRPTAKYVDDPAVIAALMNLSPNNVLEPSFYNVDNIHPMLQAAESTRTGKSYNNAVLGYVKEGRGRRYTNEFKTPQGLLGGDLCVINTAGQFEGPFGCAERTFDYKLLGRREFINGAERKCYAFITTGDTIILSRPIANFILHRLFILKYDAFAYTPRYEVKDRRGYTAIKLFADMYGVSNDEPHTIMLDISAAQAAGLGAIRWQL